MARNIMHTLRSGVSYYKIKGCYYRNSGFLEVEITKEEYDEAIEKFYTEDQGQTPPT